VFVPRRLYPLWSLLSGGHHLPLALVAERDAAGIAAFLERWRPDALSGVTAVLTQAAQTLWQSGRVHRVKALTIEGETLDAGICRILTEAFGARIHDRYGAREFGVWMAQSCPQRVAAGEPPYRNLHVAAWRFLVEVVDDAGRPVEPGREGRLVVTDLANRVMPFIRYDLGDIGSLAPNPARAGGGSRSWRP
jgi:phenylacetate-CoA ligase